MWIWALLCPFMIFTALYLPHLMFEPQSPYYLYTVWAGTMGTAMTLPAAISTGTTLLGSALASLGRWWSRPSQLVAGRRTAVHAGPTARMITGITVGIFLFLQAVAWQSIFSDQSIGAQEDLRRIGRGTVSIEEGPEMGTPEQAGRFIDALPEHSVALAYTSFDDEETGKAVGIVRGTCADLGSLGLPCEEKPVKVGQGKAPLCLDTLVFGWGDKAEAAMGELRVQRADKVEDVVTTEDFDTAPSLYISDERGRQLDLPSLKETAFDLLPRGAELRLVGGDTEYSAALRDQSQWAVLFGIIAVTVMAAAAALSGGAEFVRHGRALAPLTVLTGGFRVFRAGAAWSVSLPLCLAVVCSIAVGTWLAKPFDRAEFISPGLLTTILAITVVVSAVMSLWAGQVAVRQAKRWRPSGAD